MVIGKGPHLISPLIISVTFLFMYISVSHANISTKALTGKIGQKVIVEKDDGSEVRGVLKAISAKKVLVQKNNIRIIAVLRSSIVSVRTFNSSPKAASTSKGTYSSSSRANRKSVPRANYQDNRNEDGYNHRGPRHYNRQNSTDYWRKRYYRARRWRNLGIGLSITGSVLLMSYVAFVGASLASGSSDDTLQKTVTIAGAICMGIGVPMWIVGQVKKSKAGRRLRKRLRYRYDPRMSDAIVPPLSKQTAQTFVTMR